MLDNQFRVDVIGTEAHCTMLRMVFFHLALRRLLRYSSGICRRCTEFIPNESRSVTVAYSVPCLRWCDERVRLVHSEQTCMVRLLCVRCHAVSTSQLRDARRVHRCRSQVFCCHIGSSFAASSLELSGMLHAKGTCATTIVHLRFHIDGESDDQRWNAR
jgi:hypothetical protein